ncbi:MAG: PAS domain S-box protein [Rhodoferax sp.]|uniref:PAS domain S-box protein n=1 Tax=Rhodoferax sp. TaxID=50421 RepID=UPI00260A0300|nr:PAS domain S-box protein [Rhodoferax sp.]MDD5332562.1 PAS domain S-box protein [Rhodoferax sp.]
MSPFFSGISARGSFKRQIVLAFVVGFFLLIGAYSAYQINGEREHLYRDSREATTGLAQSLAVSSLAGVLTNDVVGLQEVVRSFQTYPGLRYAMVISSSCRVLAHSDPTKVGQFVSDPQSLALIKAPAQIQTLIDNALMADVAVPVGIDNRQVGWARIGLGRGKISSELREMLLSSAILVLLATAFSLLAATLIANRLGQRIGSLVRVAEQVHAGNLASRASIPGDRDEITKLADNLNQMLDALARNEERLRLASLYTRSLIEASLDPLVMISPQGTITDVNEGSVKVVGVPREDLIGTDFSNYFTEPEKGRAVYRQVFAKGSVTDYPLTIRHRDGRLTEVLYNASIYRDGDGNVLGVFAAARDVTERNKAEQEVAQLGLRNRLILDSAGEGIYGLDNDGRCTFVNPAALQLLGFKLEELMGQHSHALFHHTKPGGDPFPEQECPVQAAYKQGVVHRGSDLYWRKDGASFPVEFISTPILEAGKITGAVVAFRDITELKRAEEALRASEHFLDAIVEHIPNMVFVKDAKDFKFVRFNKAGEQLLGYSRSELIGKSDHDFFPKEQADFFVAKDRAILDSRALLDIADEPIDTRYLGRRHLHTRKIPILADDGSPLYLLGISEDITERKLAEEQLRRSEHGLADAQRIAHLGNWELDLASNVLTWSDEIYRIFEIDPKKFGASYDAFLNGIHPDDRERVNQAYTESLSSKQPYDIVHRLLMKDGRVKYVNEQCETYYAEDGKPLRSVGTVHDVSALKRAEEELQERERHSQSLLHLSRNLERAQTYAEILQAAQVEVKNIIGYQNLWVYLLSEDQAYLKALVAGGPESGTVMSEEGTATLTIAGDKMLEEIAQAKEIVLVEDAQTDPRVNKEIVARIGSRTIVNVPIILSGRHLGSVGVGTFGAEGVRIPSSSEQKYLTALASHMAAALDRIQLLAERKKAGEELLRYKDHLEEQVQQRTADLVLARNAAEAANRAKSVFLSSMSHELRTPLNAILGFSNMMRKDALLPMEQRENLDIISRSGEHLLTLINDVLEMAKIEAGRVQLESAPFDLGSLVRDVTDMMHVRAREKGLQLLIDQSSEFPRYIKGDEARVRQVLINLLGNAVKFTQQGGVTVRFGLKPDAVPQRLLIEVEDSGPGIKPEDQQIIFEPFVQLGNAAAQKGTGLGLTITRQFVQLMGGVISVLSLPGKGSTFRVELPLEKVEVGAVTLPQGADRGEIVGLAPNQPEYRILIVEDQLENQLLLSRLMKNMGLQTQLAENGEQAVRLFLSWAPQLIWMDRRMPVMDGLEATRRIRELPGGKEVKIVAVTASAFTEQREEMLKAGMDDFVRKPYRFNEIYDCLSQQLGLRYRYAETPAPAPAGDGVLTAPMLAVVPPDLRRELQDALESLEGERIATVIRQIAALDPGLYKRLSQLAGNFDYPSILKALQTNNPAGVT